MIKRRTVSLSIGHTIIRGDNPISLRDLLKIGLKRKVDRKESITIGACECGD